jgi:hypothetical protein
LAQLINNGAVAAEMARNNQIAANQVAANQVAPNQVAPNQVTPNQVAQNQVAGNQLRTADQTAVVANPDLAASNSNE